MEPKLELKLPKSYLLSYLNSPNNNNNHSNKNKQQQQHRKYHNNNHTPNSSRSSKPEEKDCNIIMCYDTMIFLGSLFIREFLSNFCTLILNSRLGKDNFLAGPLVTLYMIIVFRRSLNNPYILTMACVSAGDWGKANVAGYPGFDKKKTGYGKMFFFWAWMLTAQLLGALFAANFRADNDAIFGSEFISGAAWGSGQLYLKANLSKKETCWNKNFTSLLLSPSFNNNNDTTAIIIPTRLMKSQKAIVLDSCMPYIRIRWWFMEEMVAVLFFIVGYVHVWRWLRWQDMKDCTANEQNERYWRNLVVFAAASASLGLMTTVAFPTAHCGAHTSLFLSVYQSRSNEEKAVTANFLNEPFIRVLGGSIGCFFAVMYERVITLVDEMDELDIATTEDEYSFTLIAHKILYISDAHKKKKNTFAEATPVTTTAEATAYDDFFLHSNCSKSMMMRL